MRGQGLARVGVVVITTLALGFASLPFSSADDLKDARDKVRKELVSASTQIKAGEAEVKRATSALLDSQAQLASAQSDLANLKRKLSDAQAVQARIAAELKKAKAALTIAIQQVAEASEAVDAQKELIKVAALAEYQRHNDLVGFELIFTAETAGEIANKLQWSDTIFNATSATLIKLEASQANLAAKRKSLTVAEQEVATRNEEAKAQVSKINDLTAKASAQTARVARLVQENQRAQTAAQSELEASKAEYKQLQNKEAEIIKKIAAQAAKDAKNGVKMTASGFIYPVNAKAGSPFGMRYHPILHYYRMHWGTDFGAACGAPLFAMADGQVTSTIPTASSNGLGNYTVISYGLYKGKPISSGYAHQSKIVVKVGQFVKQGQIVGYVGTTGLSTECHLHLQMYYDGARVNPMQFLK